MQHAVALNSIANATTPVTLLTSSSQASHCHTSIMDGFRVDKRTGEIYGQFVTSSLQTNIEQYRDGIPRPADSQTQYQHLMEMKKVCNVVHVDFGGPKAETPTPVIDTLSPKPKRGPKPKLFLNPFAAIIKTAISENAHWVENAVMAGTYIAAGSSNGKLNIRPNYVRKVITMAVISTEAIESSTTFRNHDLEPIKERYIRYLAAAGRVAIHSIERYLKTHPSEKLRLEKKVLESQSQNEEGDIDEDGYLTDETVDLECRMELRMNYGRI